MIVRLGPGKLALESVKRGDETNQPQFRRMQAVREIVHAPGNVMRPVQRLAGK